MKKGRISIDQHIDAPAESVATYIGDFRNAKEWMVGVESVEKIGDDLYRLSLESPIGKLSPEARVLEHSDHLLRWVYASTIDGGGSVEVSPGENGTCTVSYSGEFRLKNKLLNRAAQAVGIERFAQMNGERSLARLKHLMEARRY
ncbi:MAG TPA: SRPBCC family protein [Rubrobacteraceae bacterium]|nr:SRPBCC family protein [Rubrobacteraceae bacterium]